MRTLFTQKELHIGYVIEGNSTSKRKQLDSDRLALLKRAVISKWRVKPIMRGNVWNEFKEDAKRACHDATKNVRQEEKKEKWNRVELKSTQLGSSNNKSFFSNFFCIHSFP